MVLSYLLGLVLLFIDAIINGINGISIDIFFYFGYSDSFMRLINLNVLLLQKIDLTTLTFKAESFYLMNCSHVKFLVMLLVFKLLE